MTICRESCESFVGSAASSHPRAMESQQKACKRFRSTKGASKARRDQINEEIRSMRALLPLAQEELERLSYLHSMSLICAFLRKSLLFQGLPAGQGHQSSLPCEAFLEALPGFLLVLRADGRLLYVSDNVSQYLGSSMVDVLQGDSFYDMVERPDVEHVKSELERNPTSSTERSFTCRLHASKSFRLQHGSCSLLVRGRYHPLPSSPRPGSPARCVFMALCTPTADHQRTSPAPQDPNSFCSSHRPDMSFSQLSDSVLFLLGYSAEEMIGRSWYSLLHPDDLALAASSHKNLMQADEGCQEEMVLRVQSRELSWCWFYICATRESADQEVSCSNYSISETEAIYLRKKVLTDTYCPSATPPLPLAQGSCPSPTSQMPLGQESCLGRGSKRQRAPSSEELHPRVKMSRVSESDVFYLTCSSSDSVSPTSSCDTPTFLCTPPYSPTSSNSPLQQEDSRSHFLLDVCSHTEQLLSSPDYSPLYYPHLDTHPASHPAHLPLLLGPEQAYDQGLFSQGLLSLAGPYSPESCSSPSYDYPDCTADAHLVPVCLPESDPDHPADCVLHPEDPGFPVEPLGGASSFPAQRVPQAVTPDLSSTSSLQYSEREQEEISLLAQQISSLASSFDRYHTLSPVGHQTLPPSAPTLPPSAPTLPSASTLPPSASMLPFSAPNLPPSASTLPPTASTLPPSASTLPPTSSTLPPSACDWTHPPPPVLPPLPAQLVLDKGVFDSILKDLDLEPEKEAIPLCFSHQEGPGCGVEEAHNMPLDAGLLQQTPGLSLSSLVEGLDQFSPASSPAPCPLDSLAPPTPCHHHAELHQLNQYLHCSLQQDGLVEESMY